MRDKRNVYSAVFYWRGLTYREMFAAQDVAALRGTIRAAMPGARVLEVNRVLQGVWA